MKSRTKTWEVIAAGCAFMAISIYLFNPVDTSPKNESPSQQVHIEVPSPPVAPAAPEANTVQQENLEHLEELKQVERELKKVEKELEKVSIQLDMDLSSLSGLQNLPKILIYSN